MSVPDHCLLIYFSASYLDCYPYTENGKLVIRLYDKRDDFNFSIVNFTFLSSNIPPASAYDVNVSQQGRCSRAFLKHQDIVDRGKLSTNKLLSQGYRKAKLVSTIKHCYERHQVLVGSFDVAVSKLISDLMASVEA